LEIERFGSDKFRGRELLSNHDAGDYEQAIKSRRKEL